MQIAGDRILLLTDARLQAAGRQSAPPGRATCRRRPATTPFRCRPGANRSTVSAMVARRCPGGYNLLVGRDNKLFDTAGAALLVRACRRRRDPLDRRPAGGLAHHARALMSRVHSIRQTVSAIIHGDLTRIACRRIRATMSSIRCRTPSTACSTQIELLVHGVRNVSNSIAHDLRTPLAELRSRSKSSSLMRPSPEHTFAEIDGAVADVDRVIRIFDALLRLAEIDAACAARDSCPSIWPSSRRPPSSSMSRPRNSSVSGCSFCGRSARPSRRSAPARAGAQQSDRQRAQIRARAAATIDVSVQRRPDRSGRDRGRR